MHVQDNIMRRLRNPRRFLRAASRYAAAYPSALYATMLPSIRLSRLLGMSPRGPEIDLAQVNRMLVVRLDDIGDMVLTTPLLRELRRNLPEAKITLLVKPLVHNLVELCPYVDEVLIFDETESGIGGPLRRHWRAWHLAHAELWPRRFDLAILPRWDADRYHGSFVTYLSAARWRVGYSVKIDKRKRQFNRGFDNLFTHVVLDVTPKHEVERGLDLIRFLGGTVREESLELWLSAEDELRANQLLASHGVDARDLLIAFGPGTDDPKRQWPIANFVALGDWLKREYRARLVVIGGNQDKPLGQVLQTSLGNQLINATGQLTLRQTTALLARCDLFLGNDSGPMHLAAAVGVPVVEISAHPVAGPPLHPRSPVRFGPWGVPCRVLQPSKAIAPCSDACTATRPHCILSVTVDPVKAASSLLLSQRTAQPTPPQTFEGHPKPEST